MSSIPVDVVILVRQALDDLDCLRAYLIMSESHRGFVESRSLLLNFLFDVVRDMARGCVDISQVKSSSAFEVIQKSTVYVASFSLATVVFPCFLLRCPDAKNRQSTTNGLETATNLCEAHGSQGLAPSSRDVDFSS